MLIERKSSPTAGFEFVIGCSRSDLKPWQQLLRRILHQTRRGGGFFWCMLPPVTFVRQVLPLEAQIREFRSFFLSTLSLRAVQSLFFLQSVPLNWCLSPSQPGFFWAPKTKGGVHCGPLAKTLLPFSESIQVKFFWKLVPGAYAERFWGGFTKSSWGSGGRCGAPENFEIIAFQRLRTPVSLSFLSQCCYTKIHAIFFIQSSAPLPAEWGRAQSHALIPKKPMSKNCPVLSLVLHLNHEACWCSELWKQFLSPHCMIQGQKKLFTVICISTCTLCQSDGREYSLYMRAWLTVFTLSWWALPHWCCPCLQQVDCERSAASRIFSQRLVLNV